MIDDNEKSNGKAMQDFEGKVAVITGAASGIGEALARCAAGNGMKLVLADLDAERLHALREQLTDTGTEAVSVVTDVADDAQVERLAQESLSAFGCVDLLFNNAGVLLTGPSWACSLEDWQKVLGVNLWGVIHGIRRFVPLMLAQGTPAHIVNTASMAGLIAAPLNGPYTVSKQGVVALSETLHYELAAQQAPVKVSVVCPGPVATTIADSAQPHRSGRTDQERAFEAMLRQGIAAGMSPDELAGQVFTAIREEQFWVLPHDAFREPLQRRTESLLTGRDPEFRWATF